MDPIEDKYAGQAAMLANRVKKRFNHLRKRYARQHLDIFRLYDWDIPEIRAVVDWYGGHLVVGEYSRRQSTPQWLPMMGESVAQKLGVPPKNLHLKIRRSGVKEGKRYERLKHTNEQIPMQERDLKFYINLNDYVDTGLFSDHRNTRSMVRRLAAGSRFLNLYCYTGSFTCYAAKGGATQTVSVDRSETAINWAGENLALNGLAGSRHTLVQKDVLEFLDSAGADFNDFDLAVIDPPSYSTTRLAHRHFDLASEHPLLLNKAFQLMKPGAAVFFSTNHQNFQFKTDKVCVSDVEEITQKTIPEDYLNKRKQIHRCWKIRV